MLRIVTPGLYTPKESIPVLPDLEIAKDRSQLEHELMNMKRRPYEEEVDDANEFEVLDGDAGSGKIGVGSFNSLGPHVEHCEEEENGHEIWDVPTGGDVE